MAGKKKRMIKFLGIEFEDDGTITFSGNLLKENKEHLIEHIDDLRFWAEKIVSERKKDKDKVNYSPLKSFGFWSGSFIRRLTFKFPPKIRQSLF